MIAAESILSEGRHIMRFIILGALFFMGAGMAHAADPRAALPEPIAGLEKDGATLTYLGDDLGYQAWRAAKDDQDQYFYVAPDGQSFFLGILFNKNGRAVTFDQLKRLAGTTAPPDLANAPSQKTEPQIAPPNQPNTDAGLSKSEQLWKQVTAAHSITWATDMTAPTLYVVADPLCPHCKDLLTLLRPLVQVGTIKINIILVGVVHPDSGALAAGIMDSKTPVETLLALIDGKALPEKGAENDPRLAQNLGILTQWGFAGTPITVYRAKDGVIKLLEGVPKTAQSILKDLR
jgi:hypothetical protein